MRTVLIWSDQLAAPEAPAPIVPEPIERPDALPTFDPATGITLDGETVYLTARVGIEAFDGSQVAPEALSVHVFDPTDPEHPLAAEARTAIRGPGPIAVPIEGLVPGATYRFDLMAEYPD